MCNQKPPFRAHTQTHKLSILFAWRERRSAHAEACGHSSSGAVGEGWGDYVGTELLHKVTPPKLARRTPGESGITTMLGWTKEPGPKLRHKLRAHRKHTKNIVRCGQPHHHVARLPRSKPSPVTGQGAVCLYPTRREAKVRERRESRPATLDTATYRAFPRHTWWQPIYLARWRILRRLRFNRRWRFFFHLSRMLWGRTEAAATT